VPRFSSAGKLPGRKVKERIEGLEREALRACGIKGNGNQEKRDDDSERKN
jgi:hypothetical protein